MGKEISPKERQIKKELLFHENGAFPGTADRLVTPCSEKEEAYLVEKISRLPLWEAYPSSFNVRLDARTDINSELLSFNYLAPGGNGDLPHRKQEFYLLPAGMTMNLALAAIRNLGIFNKELWEIEEADMPAPTISSDGEEIEDMDALRLFALGSLMRYLLKNVKGVHPEKVTIYLNEVPFLRPSCHPSTKGVVNAIHTLGRKPYYFYGAEMQSLIDIVFYSLLFFSMRKNRSYLKLCPLCGRPFFQDCGTTKYCHFRNNDEWYGNPELSCSEAIDNIRALDGKYKGDVADKKKAIERPLSLKHRPTKDDLFAFQREYESCIQETQKDRWQYRKRLMFLEKYAEQHGTTEKEGGQQP
ncbi:hypothetical protein [Eggerthella sp. YY7918]|uniref:hypothetical protein n=1 Tax=Eggerthella sp. (strain YY7918) TaxID=502558 RepID=UPI0002170F7A|nr:hypothetical protein [Eggerthella sp. YY7918]BAK43303.1 hypothetical protein EGYY_00200 [Eggerthella sp. YY7918]